MPIAFGISGGGGAVPSLNALANARAKQNPRSDIRAGGPYRRCAGPLHIILSGLWAGLKPSTAPIPKTLKFSCASALQI